MKILNLTQHKATPEQIEAGVVDLADDDFTKIKSLLTFESRPSYSEMLNRAYGLLGVFVKYKDEDGEIKYSMIDGAPYFMPVLENYLKDYDARPIYSFSKRESREVLSLDGKVVKTSVFVHDGFIVP